MRIDTDKIFSGERRDETLGETHMPGLFTLSFSRTVTGRLIILAILLAMVVGAMHSCYLKSYAYRPAIAPPDRQPMVAADTAANADEPLAELEAIPNLDLLRENIVGGVAEDDETPWRAADLLRIRPALEDLFRWLKSQSHESLAAAARPRHLWNYNKIMREPGRWRLQILHVYGELAHEQIEELPGLPAGLRRLHRLTLFDRRMQVFYTVLTPLKSALAEIGKDVACDGVFLMRYSYQREGGGWQRTPLFVARRAVLAYEMPTPVYLLDMRQDPGPPYGEIRPRSTITAIAPAYLEEQIFDPAVDGSDGLRMLGGDVFDEARKLRAEKAALDHAFAYIYGLDDDTIKRRINPEVDYIAVMQEAKTPTWMRGQIMHFEGQAADVMTEWFSGDTEGIERIHFVTAWDSRYRGFQHTWMLAVLNLPEGLRQDDRIEAEGVFIKRVPFKTRQNTWRFAPLIICKEIRRVPPPQASFYVATALSALFVAIVVVFYWFSLRENSVYLRLRERVRQRRGGKKGVGAATGGAPEAVPPNAHALAPPAEDKKQ